MTRPAGITRRRYAANIVRDRAITVRPLARLRERLIAARAPEPTAPAPDGLPLPPARLRVLVDGHGDPDKFLADSRAGAAMIRETLGGAGIDLASLGSVLDFGCGCGRTARQWADLGLDLHGCDYNSAGVEWCRGNLPFLAAEVNQLQPPAPYPEDRFDLVYAISILTHLSDELARRWVAEWRRVVRPGGLLLVTTIGDARRESLGTRNGDRARYDAGEPVFKSTRVEGLNACVAHHPASYVHDELLAGLELLRFTPGGTVPGFQQDAHLARLPA